MKKCTKLKRIKVRISEEDKDEIYRKLKGESLSALVRNLLKQWREK